MIAHGVALCYEYYKRYGKVHSCSSAVQEARAVFNEKTKKDLSIHRDVKDFAFAGPDQFKYDTSIDIFTAYKRYIASKPWVVDNYLRNPSRKPNWL